jgi:hypothetical protein
MTRRWTTVLAAAPAGALALAWLGLSGAAALWGNPLWRVEPLNLAEAAALRDAGEVARLLKGGAAPDALYPVRAGFLFRKATTLTPLDAATRAERPEIVQLLLDLQAPPERLSVSRAWYPPPAEP